MKDDEIIPYLFRSTATFAIVAPQPHKAISDAINTAIQNMLWYRDKYPEIARQILEYDFRTASTLSAFQNHLHSCSGCL
jgi:hypothetical protein